MSFNLKRNLLILATILLIIHMANCQDEAPEESEEEDDSSSEETVEDSNESTNRRRRSAEEIGGSAVPKSNEVDKTKPNRALPGLPDTATILKIAEILTTVGQEVLPVLVEGNGAGSMVADRLDRDVKYFKNIKSQFDMFLEKFKRK